VAAAERLDAAADAGEPVSDAAALLGVLL